MNIVIILGSSRTNGETGQIVNQLQNITKWDVIDLNDYKINNYDYEHKNKNDDYLPLMRNLINKYDVFIFATPVYWYSMSATMKTFFDRFTALLDDEKELGRRLRMKSMAAISSSQGSNLGDGFWLPFLNSAEYLGMKYLGNTHFVTDQDEKENMTKFIALINNSTKETYNTKC